MVILVSIDGMRPDALGSRTPVIQSLTAKGSSSLTAQTVMPCCTLPCHTSMLRGVDMPRHGITTNTFQPLVRPVPSIIDVAHASGKRCGFFYNWGPLRDLCDPESLAIGHFLRDSHRPEGDIAVTETALRYLEGAELDFLFLYLGWTDECGHMHGWMSEPYLQAVADADACVGRVLARFPEADFLVMSDHGGHDRTHGTLAPEDMTIPFILSGPSVPSGRDLGEVIIYDAAPTLAGLLGISAAREWDGRDVLGLETGGIQVGAR